MNTRGKCGRGNCQNGKCEPDLELVEKEPPTHTALEDALQFQVRQEARWGCFRVEVDQPHNAQCDTEQITMVKTGCPGFWSMSACISRFWSARAFYVCRVLHHFRTVWPEAVPQLPCLSWSKIGSVGFVFIPVEANTRTLHLQSVQYKQDLAGGALSRALEQCRVQKHCSGMQVSGVCSHLLSQTVAPSVCMVLAIRLRKCRL